MNKLNERQISSEAALIKIGSELALTLYGEPSTVDRYFKASDVREREYQLFRVQESLIKNGLIQIWSQQRHSRHESSFKYRMSSIISELLNSPKWTYLSFPLLLPKAPSLKVPNDVLSKAAIEGFDPSYQELKPYLAGSHRTQVYETFRRLYSPVVLGGLVLSSAVIAYDNVKQEIVQQADAAIHEVRVLNQTIGPQVDAYKRAEADQALQRALAEFRKKWGEDPTEQELHLLKTQIANALLKQQAPQ